MMVFITVANSVILIAIASMILMQMVEIKKVLGHLKNLAIVNQRRVIGLDIDDKIV